jgi:hypothetical protein
MAGSFKNRHSALVLAIFLGLIAAWCVPLGAAPIEGDGTPAPGGPTGDKRGDPDVPTGSTRSSATRGAQSADPRSGVTRIVGDGAGAQAPQVVWMWRIRIVLQGLRAYTFRF